MAELPAQVVTGAVTEVVTGAVAVVEEAAAMEEYSSSVAGVGATLGDIMKEQMESSDGGEGDK